MSHMHHAAFSDFLQKNNEKIYFYHWNSIGCVKHSHLSQSFARHIIHPAFSVKYAICVRIQTGCYTTPWHFRYPRKPVDNLVEKSCRAFIDAAFNRLPCFWAHISLHDFRLFYARKIPVLTIRPDSCISCWYRTESDKRKRLAWIAIHQKTVIISDRAEISLSSVVVQTMTQIMRKQNNKKKRHCSRSIWRKGRDLNPRYGVTVYRISSPAHSTTLPPFRISCRLNLLL